MRPLWLITLCLFYASFANADYYLQKSRRLPTAIDSLPHHSVADMHRIPQNLRFFAKQVRPWSRIQQLQAEYEYNRLYFLPWTLKRLDINPNDFGWDVRFVTKNKLFTRSGKPIALRTIRRWIANADYDKRDTLRRYAVTTERVNLHALPTLAQFYRDPSKPGEGFPFNYNQTSALHINVPLYVSHLSKDKRWAFVRASYAFGWVRLQDIGFVDKNFIKRFKTGRYGMTIKDNLRLYNEQGKAVSFVKLGTIFPLSNRHKGRYLVAVRDSKGNARIKNVIIRSKGLIALKPLPFTPQNVAKVAKEFYGEPYGWGGGYGCRDCSATTRDFLGVFGIFLPRNSSKQAKAGKKILSIGSLDPESKKKFIVQHAEPFRSLLYVPGHIVLYLGQYKGEPVIMHTYWGIRKNDGTKLITARTIISTTEPGKERQDVRKKSMLSHTLQSIITF